MQCFLKNGNYNKIYMLWTLLLINSYVLSVINQYLQQGLSVIDYNKFCHIAIFKNVVIYLIILNLISIFETIS